MKVLILSHPRAGSTFIYSILHKHVCPALSWHWGNNMLYISDAARWKFVNLFYGDAINIDQGYDRLYTDISNTCHLVNKCHMGQLHMLQQSVGDERYQAMLDQFDYKILLNRNPFDIALSDEIRSITTQTGDWTDEYDYSSIIPMSIDSESIIKRTRGVKRMYNAFENSIHFDEVIDYDKIKTMEINDIFPTLKLAQYYPHRTIHESELNSHKSPDKKLIVSNYAEIMAMRDEISLL